MLSRRAFLALATLGAPAWAQQDEAAWRRMRTGNVVLLVRHASTEPGLGDPPQFRLGDCATQRNLSAQGRDESRRIGERLRDERVKVARVYTSPWCRCRETATLAFGRAEDWEPLSSWFDFPDREARYTEAVKKRIAGYVRAPQPGVVVMVTHNLNIAALSKHSVATAEGVVMRPDGCCDARPMQRLRLL